MSILISFTKSVMHKRLTKMLTGITHKRIHKIDKFILYHIYITHNTQLILNPIIIFVNQSNSVRKKSEAKFKSDQILRNFQN